MLKIPLPLTTFYCGFEEVITNLRTYVYNFPLKNALSKILNEADQLRRGYSKFIHITVWSIIHQARQCLANFLEG